MLELLCKPLYHGSVWSFKRVDVSKGRPYKDFGKGFYMSVDRAQAIGMMHKKYDEIVERSSDELPRNLVKSLYRIELEPAAVERLRVKVFERADATWLDFVLRCRQVEGVVHDNDLVIGPMADDDTRLLMKNYVDGVYGDPDDPAAKETLLRLLKPERLGVQVFVGSQRVADMVIKDLHIIDWRECV